LFGRVEIVAHIFPILHTRPAKRFRAALMASLRSVTRGLAVAATLASVASTTVASDATVVEAKRFIEIQQDSYNVMVTGQGRLKRACSVPLDPGNVSQIQALPDLKLFADQLKIEAKQFATRASARFSAAKRDRTLQCKNPLGKVLELFGAKSACAEAGEVVASRQAILSIANKWQGLLGLQLEVLAGARQLELEGCLSSGFTEKLTRAYEDSVRPRGAPLEELFNRWTSN
jgi:hypothetical protein